MRPIHDKGSYVLPPNKPSGIRGQERWVVSTTEPEAHLAFPSVYTGEEGARTKLAGMLPPLVPKGGLCAFARVVN